MKIIDTSSRLITEHAVAILPWLPGMKPLEIIVWFSCGAASAVAAKQIVDTYGHIHNVRVVNNPVVEEDADNRRFMYDVEQWIGQPIETAINPKYSHASASKVWDDVKYVSGNLGAPCTRLLKKGARLRFETINECDWHVFGFTLDEKKRSDRFMLTERSNVIPILIDHKITKQNCYDIIKDAGIALPRLYLMGYPNANCIGCVKVSSPTYWNHVRRMHPEIFWARARQSRRLGARLVRVKGVRIFLDELHPDARGRDMKHVLVDCSVICEESA